MGARTDSLASRLRDWLMRPLRRRRAMQRRELERAARRAGCPRSLAKRVARQYFDPEGAADAQ